MYNGEFHNVFSLVRAGKPQLVSIIGCLVGLQIHCNCDMNIIWFGNSAILIFATYYFSRAKALHSYVLSCHDC